MTSCRSIGITDSGVLRGYVYDPATAMIAAAVIGGGSQMIAADKAASAANKSSNNQKALIQTQVDAYNKYKSVLEGLDKGGTFNSSMQEAQAKRDSKIQSETDLRNMAGSLLAGGASQGSTVARDALTSLEAKAQTRLASVLNAIRQNADMNKLTAYSALNSNSQSLSGGINAYGQEAGYYRNKADQAGDLSGIVSGISQYFQKQNTSNKSGDVGIWEYPRNPSQFTSYSGLADSLNAYSTPLKDHSYLWKA